MWLSPAPARWSWQTAWCRGTMLVRQTLQAVVLPLPTTVLCSSNDTVGRHFIPAVQCYNFCNGCCNNDVSMKRHPDQRSSSALLQLLLQCQYLGLLLWWQQLYLLRCQRHDLLQQRCSRGKAGGWRLGIHCLLDAGLASQKLGSSNRSRHGVAQPWLPA